jgi:hypothetical protein
MCGSGEKTSGERRSDPFVAEPWHAVFISYASQDAQATHRHVKQLS